MKGKGAISSAATLDAVLSERPIIVAVAGSNGAGKSTYFHTFLENSGLPFVNADVISLETSCDAYAAAAMAEDLRRDLVQQKQSFIFETVFSDPVGDKVRFLEEAANLGYTVVLIFIGIDSPETSNGRVALRVSQGGHDVPRDKIAARYSRTLANLRLAIQKLPMVIVYDNSDMASPYRQVALFQDGVETAAVKPFPKWFPTESV